jgi:prepilin-type N-terminal cleavage/methylation domain-containing protein
MNGHRRRAFTLVELLVVIAIIGTLVALLLPAVQHARESSRRSTCASNIRNVQLATLQYEERFRSFPGLFEPIPAERLKSESGYPNTTWAVTLLDDLERAGIAASNKVGELTDTYVAVYVCPSDGSKTRNAPELSYVANGGRLGSVTGEKMANGPFINHVYHPKLLMQDGNWMDGRDYTPLAKVWIPLAIPRWVGTDGRNCGSLISRNLSRRSKRIARGAPFFFGP